jgi:CRISPR-associated protein Cas2
VTNANNCDLVVVCYDIADNKRRYRIARALEGYGLRVQESVIECWLTPGQLMELRRKLKNLMRESEDRIVYYTLRPADRQRFRSLGCGAALTEDFCCAVF